MTVAELAGVKQFHLATADRRAPGPGEIEVRVDAVGICGSDMHSYLEGGVGDTPCQYPMVLGHEPSGTVERLGPGVTGWSKGDKAALEPSIHCYHCRQCMAGRHNGCEHLRFFSMPGEPGFFREFAVVPAHNLIGLPPGVGQNEATLIEPLAVALHSLALAPLAPGSTAAVLGSGPIGLMTIAVLKLSGARRIYASDPVPHRRDMARAIGADMVFDPAEGNPGEAIWHDTAKRGVDAVFDCAAKGDTLNEAVAAATYFGRVVLTGIPSELELPVKMHPWRRKELSIHQVRRSNREAEAARDLLGLHPWLAQIITHDRPLASITDAFSIVETYSDGVGKLIIQPALY